MNVLSLFDGISCGRVALERVGIQVDNYYASEIDKHAIKVAQSNYPDTIQLGDINEWESWDLPQIDLIMGGSPCQGFSFAGKRLDFEDPRSKLFFKFVECFEYYKPKYFLLENVRMKKESENLVSEILDIRPKRINSSLFSAQSRNRLYWTNINYGHYKPQKDFRVKDILEHDYYYDYNHIPDNKTIENQLTYLLESSKYKHNFKWRWDKENRVLVMRPDGLKIQRIGRVAFANNKTEIVTSLAQPYLFDGENIRKVTPLEAERLQTLPDGYTQDVSNAQRYKAIGNGWTVDVIAHILKGVK